MPADGAGAAGFTRCALSCLGLGLSLQYAVWYAAWYFCIFAPIRPLRSTAQLELLTIVLSALFMQLTLISTWLCSSVQLDSY